ncbi:RHS repeat-associated core domain-containing protein [Flavobacterium sp. N2013]|uniref:RHS repeat-associated core domain-containing protein n=1 Tax=Flavobacterium TaxID=237 RepID=UPI0039B5A0E3
MITITTPTSVATTDYLGGYQYKNTVLQFFPTAEGYVKNTPVSGTNTYSYVFNYTDHLGNVRLSYTKNPSTNVLTILEESNYYPFGLKHNGYNPISPIPENRRLFNGKELQEELGLNSYDYGARNYDPALGRWMNIDPLAETSRRFSPYTYALNNPVLFIDPDGMEAYKSQVDRSSGMSNSEWNSNRRADMDRQAGGDGIDVANPNGYVKPKYTVTASDADNEVEKEDGDSNEDKPKKKNNLAQNIKDNPSKISEVAEVAISLKKLRMLEIRQGLSIKDRIGTLGKFSSKYASYSKAGKVLGKVNNVAMGYSTFLDVKSYYNGQLSGARLSYRLGSNTATIVTSSAVGTEFGGPVGTIAGFVVGLGTSAGEIIYDGWNNNVMPVINQGVYEINNNHGYSNFHP